MANWGAEIPQSANLGAVNSLVGSKRIVKFLIVGGFVMNYEQAVPYLICGAGGFCIACIMGAILWFARIIKFGKENPEKKMTNEPKLDRRKSKALSTQENIANRINNEMTKLREQVTNLQIKFRTSCDRTLVITTWFTLDSGVYYPLIEFEVNIHASDESLQLYLQRYWTRIHQVEPHYREDFFISGPLREVDTALNDAKFFISNDKFAMKKKAH